MSQTEHTEQSDRNGVDLRILAVADEVDPLLYRSTVARWLPPIDLLISCGDLPPDYLDFLASALNVRLVHVIGNHCDMAHDAARHCSAAAYTGALNLNGRVVSYDWGGEGQPEIIMGGLEGSPQYNEGPHQYTEQEARLLLSRMVPGLLLNKLRTGRYLDIMVTHAPPRGVHDLPDQAHHGFESLLHFVALYRPALLLHGHSHRYERALPMRSDLGGTTVINAFPYVLLEMCWQGNRSGWRLKLRDQERTAHGG